MVTGRGRLQYRFQRYASYRNEICNLLLHVTSLSGMRLAFLGQADGTCHRLLGAATGHDSLPAVMFTLLYSEGSN